MTHELHLLTRRTLRALLFSGVLAAAVLAAPCASAWGDDPTLALTTDVLSLDTLPGVSGDSLLSASPTSPCSGFSSVHWPPELPLFFEGTHRVQIACRPIPGVAYFVVSCSTNLIMPFYQDATGDVSYSYCLAGSTTHDAFLLDTPGSHDVKFSVTIIPANGHRIVWSGVSNICTGQGTATETCTSNYNVSAGHPVTHHYV